MLPLRRKLPLEPEHIPENHAEVLSQIFICGHLRYDLPP